MDDDFFDGDILGMYNDDDCTGDSFDDECCDIDDEISGEDDTDFDDAVGDELDDVESEADGLGQIIGVSDAVILGSMIAGSAYEDAIAQNNRLRMLSSKDKGKE